MPANDSPNFVTNNSNFVHKQEVNLKTLTKVLLIAFVLILAGFSAKELKIVEILENEFFTEQTVVNETNDKNAAIIDYVEDGSMLASWYGPGFHGKQTANGEFFNEEAFTAAHKSLKFGTLLRLTNLKNGKFVIVRINDRGPYWERRNLDLSKAAARELGMVEKGVARLKVEYVALKGINNPIIAM